MKLYLRRAVGLAVVVIGLAGCPAWATSYTNTMAQTTAYITNAMNVGNIAGVSIVLVDDQSVVWSSGFGLADREQGVAADADTVYHIGSVSKSFAAMAIMQLLDDGRIDLEAPLTNYMAEFSMLPRFTNSGPVTIRSLLNHHSGLPGDLFNGMWTTPLRDDFMERHIRYLQSDYPFAPVNERYYYCNTGWVLLSDVVRRLEGRSFAAATDARIFTPLGMAASSFIPDKPAISNRLAACYDGAGNRQPLEYLNCLGSGSMYSSANDLAKFIRMLLADGRYDGQTIISTNALAAMITPQLTNLPLNVEDNPQGLGWDSADDPRFRYAGRVIWKDGATLFYCGFLGFSPDLKLGVAVIQNSPGSQCDSMGMTALRWAILDKQGADWRTNSVYVPPFSPVTNRPQAELDALAGWYVGASGGARIVAETGTLTMIGAANTDAPDIISNLVPRANGWFSKADSQANQLAFTNLAGHDMLVLHAVDGSRESVSAVGELYVPGPLSAAWSARTNRTYRIVDMDPFDYLWAQPSAKTLRLSVKDGVLLANWMFGSFVEEPQNDTLAFQRGVHCRKGGAIQVFMTNGYELLRHSSYRFLDEAAIPTLAAPAVTNGAIPFDNGTQWYWFAGQSGQTYRVFLTAPNRNYFVRLTDRGGQALSLAKNQPLGWTCSADGTYAIAVSATSTFAFTISLAVVGSRQVQSDYDGDGKADPAVFDSASGMFTVFRSGSGYVPASVVMSVQPAASGLAPIPGDYDGDGKADPAVYDPIVGQLLVRLSAQSYCLYTIPIGNSSYAPVCGDFDGDHKADPALYSAASAQMAAWLSSAGYNPAAVVPLGGAGWLNASEDYDGDGKTDPAVYESASGAWQVLLSGAAYAPVTLVTVGGVGVVPVPGDYDGDGKADPTLFQSATGFWLSALSSQNYAQTSFAGVAGSALVACAGDYDNDGKTDPAVCDAAARTFYVMLSGSGYVPASLNW